MIIKKGYDRLIACLHPQTLCVHVIVVKYCESQILWVTSLFNSDCLSKELLNLRFIVILFYWSLFYWSLICCFEVCNNIIPTLYMLATPTHIDISLVSHHAAVRPTTHTLHNVQFTACLHNRAGGTTFNLWHVFLEELSEITHFGHNCSHSTVVCHPYIGELNWC